MIDRISREQMLLEIAHAVALRGTCRRLSVGAVIAREYHPLEFGYVGAPPGEAHCDEFNCDLTQPCTRTWHAEFNVIRRSKERSINLLGASMFCTDSPCLQCAMNIRDSGITRVYYDRRYRRPEGILYLESNNVVVVQLKRYVTQS